MPLISNGDGTAIDTGTGLYVPLTTVLPPGVPADGYQAQSTPAPTSGTDDTARLFGGLAQTTLSGGMQVATAAFGSGAASAVPSIFGKPAPAPVATTGWSWTQIAIGGLALGLAADYFLHLGYVFKKGA